ncbi:hypothetical protein EC988_008542, partial [Linderina pennispora]
MGIFSPTNPVRVWLARLFSHRLTSCLMTALLLAYFCVCASENLDSPEPHGLVDSWPRAIRSALFFVFTVEMMARIIVTGFLFDQQLTPTDLYVNIMGKIPAVKWLWKPKDKTEQQGRPCGRRRRRHRRRQSQNSSRPSAPMVPQKPPRLQVPESPNRADAALGDRQQTAGDAAATQGTRLSPSVIPSSASRSSYTVSTISGIIHDIAMHRTPNTRIRRESPNPSTPPGSPEWSDEEPAQSGHRQFRRHRDRSPSVSDGNASPYDGYSSGSSHPSRRQSITSNESLYS